MQDSVQFVPNALLFNPADQIIGKGVGQEALGRLLTNPPRLQIENRLLIQVSGGRTVGAFDIVGINFQLEASR